MEYERLINLRNSFKEFLRNEIRNKSINEIKNEVRNKINNQFIGLYIEILYILISQKFNIVQYYIHNMHLRIKDCNLVTKIYHSINKFHNTDSLNSFIQQQLSHVT